MANIKVKYDFWMIYNRSKASPTEDERKAANFTEYLVEFLEENGEIKGYCPDRDAIPGKELFNLNEEMLENSRKIIVVVTPELIKNGWQKFCQKCSLKRLIDNNQKERLIPIALGISEEEKKEHHDMELWDWIYFDDHDYREMNNTIQKKWNRIKKAVDPNASVQLSITECGDNRLRTEHRNLVTQPTEFFSDDLIMEIGEKFPSDWKILCIKLGLKDDEACAIEQDNQKDSRMQAFKGLKRSLSTIGSDDKNRLDRLVKVLQNLGRNDIIATVQRKHYEYQSLQMSSQSETSHGIDIQDGAVRVDAAQGGTAQGDAVQVVSIEPTLPDNDVDNPDSSMETDFMSRELRPSETAVMNTLQRSANLPSNSVSVSMDAGPSVSLPTAPLVKLTKDQSNSSVVNSETSYKTDEESRQTSENISNNNNDSSTSSLSGTSPQLKSEEPVRQTKSQDRSHQRESKTGPAADDNQGQHTDQTLLKTPYANQYSLSNDVDITVDNGEAVLTEQNDGQLTTSAVNNLDILDQSEMLNLKSFENDPVSTDSGVSSFANTPIAEHGNSMANTPRVEDCSGKETLTETVLKASHTDTTATPVNEKFAPPLTGTVGNAASNTGTYETASPVDKKFAPPLTGIVGNTTSNIGTNQTASPVDEKFAPPLTGTVGNTASNIGTNQTASPVDEKFGPPLSGTVGNTASNIGTNQTASHVDQKIAPALNQSVMSSPPTSSGSTVNQSTLPGDRSMEIENQRAGMSAQSSSSDKPTSSSTGRDDSRRNRWVSNLASSVLSMIVRPEYGFY